MPLLLTEYNKCANTRMLKIITTEHKVLWGMRNLKNIQTQLQIVWRCYEHAQIFIEFDFFEMSTCCTGGRRTVMDLASM